MSEDSSENKMEKPLSKSDRLLKYFLLTILAVCVYLLPDWLQHLAWIF